jgi:hypothetical protein
VTPREMNNIKGGSRKTIKSTNKLKTTNKKTVNNTTKKEGGKRGGWFDSLKVALGALI